MATSSLTLPGTALETVNAITAVKRAILTQKNASDGKGTTTSSGGKGSRKQDVSVSFPWGPQNLDFDKLGLRYSEISRPELKPILVASAPQLRTVSFSAVIADKETGGKLPVQNTINVLETIADEDVDCEFSYGLASLPFRVRLTQFSYSAVRRNSDGNVIQASISIQLTETVAIDQDIVKLTAVIKTPSTLPTAPSGRSSGPVDAEPLVLTSRACTSIELTQGCNDSRWRASTVQHLLTINDAGPVTVPAPRWPDRRGGPA